MRRKAQKDKAITIIVYIVYYMIVECKITLTITLTRYMAYKTFITILSFTFIHSLWVVDNMK